MIYAYRGTRGMVCEVITSSWVEPDPEETTYSIYGNTAGGDSITLPGGPYETEDMAENALKDMCQNNALIFDEDMTMKVERMMDFDASDN